MQHSKIFSRVILLCCLFLSGCNLFNTGSSTHTPAASGYNVSVGQSAVRGTINQPVASRGCGRAAPTTPGSSVDQTFAVDPADSHGYSTRSYRVHVPGGYQNTAPTPLLLYFHGFGGNALGGDQGSGFSALADQRTFLVAYGQGLPDGQGDARGWANTGPIDYGVDEVHAVSLMLDDLQNKLCVDARRVYVTGFSNGGGMSYDLACNLAGRIAAFVPASGDYYAIPGGCHPSRPTPIMEIHGSADPLVPYQGDSDTSWPHPAISQWLQDWAARDGCQQGPVVFLQTAQVMGEQWTSCQQGAVVVHYRIEGGGHSWPAMLGTRSSLEVVWDFFQAHPLPI